MACYAAIVKVNWNRGWLVPFALLWPLPGLLGFDVQLACIPLYCCGHRCLGQRDCGVMVPSEGTVDVTGVQSCWDTVGTCARGWELWEQYLSVLPMPLTAHEAAIFVPTPLPNAQLPPAPMLQDPGGLKPGTRFCRNSSFHFYLVFVLRLRHRSVESVGVKSPPHAQNHSVLRLSPTGFDTSLASALPPVGWLISRHPFSSCTRTPLSLEWTSPKDSWGLYCR